MTTYSWFGGSLGTAYQGRYEVSSDWINESTGVRANGFPQPGDTAEIDALVPLTVHSTGAYIDVSSYDPAIYLFPDQPLDVLDSDPLATVGWTITAQTIDLNAGPGLISVWMEQSALTDDILNVTGTVLLADYLSNAVSGTIAVGTSGDPAFLQAILYGFDTSKIGPSGQASQDTFNANITVGTGSEFDVEAYPNAGDPTNFANNGAISVQPGGTLMIDDTDGSGLEETGGHTSFAINNGIIMVSGAAGETTSATLDINTEGSGAITVDGHGALPTATSLLIEGSVTGQTITASDATVQIDDAPVANSSPGTAGFDINGGEFTFGDSDVTLQLHQAPLTSLQFVNGALEQQPDGRTPFTTPIAGFRAGDTIDLVGKDLGGNYDTAYDPTTGVLQVESPASTAGYPPEIIAALTLAGTYDPSLFLLAGNTSTQDLDVLYTGNPVPCFGAGTRIATPAGEIAVEHLRIGDHVATLFGRREQIRWIGRRSYAGRFIAGNRDRLPVCIRQGALGDGLPRHGLLLSPQHALFLDGILIPAVALVNGVSVVQLESVDHVRYFHIELAQHDILFAEGVAAESFIDDGGRMMFHNADEYRALYPHDIAPPALYCAPRFESGVEVDRIWGRIAALAGILPDAGELGPLRGFVDMAVDHDVAGWAQHASMPETPVCLDILAHDRLLTQVLANRYRGDLVAAGIGGGYHGFVASLPTALDDGTRSTLIVRRSADGAALPRSHSFEARRAA